jgi:hypothetical protein
MVPIRNAGCKGPKADGDLVSLQAPEVAIIVYFRLKEMLLLYRGSLNDHSVSV